jgi:hypothetical protein
MPMDDEQVILAYILAAYFTPLAWIISFFLIRKISKWHTALYGVSLVFYILLAGILLVLGFVIHDIGAFALAVLGCVILDVYSLIALFGFIILKVAGKQKQKRNSFPK